MDERLADGAMMSLSTLPQEGRASDACLTVPAGLSEAIVSESPMAAILPIVLFVIAILAINIVEFKRPD